MDETTWRMLVCTSVAVMLFVFFDWVTRNDDDF